MTGTKKFLILLLCSFSFAAGTLAQVQAPDARRGLALVVGISQYQQPAIPALTSADKDAGVFAGWLQSKAGGSLPGYNIKLLTNENATIAAVYSAMDWLKENAKEGDVVYLYFSGHGDVEIDSSRIAQGYLLCYNSPANNYVNNAVSIEDLNACADALTIKNKATVVMITDACHTGKLAGDNYKGKQLTAQNLRAVQNFQVRIAACGEDEEAAEGPAWGGGRGAFSWYLLNGVNGLADSVKDNVVRLQELDNFLQASFSSDKFLRSQGFSQHPVISGNKLFPMAGIDSSTLRALQAGNEKLTPLPAGLQSLKSVGLQPIDYFFECARDDFFERSIDFSKYINFNADEIPAALVQDYIYYQHNMPETDYKWINDDTRYRIETPQQLAMLSMLAGQLQKNKILITRFNEKFVETVQGKGQEMINAYLQGDIAEIEKRQYFNSGKRIYENFLNEVILARRLVNPGHYLSSILEVQQAYLSGLNDRLKMETSVQIDTLLRSAFQHQHEALALSPYAPFIHNEIANLYFIDKNVDSAAYHYNMATILAPTWAIPWSNMIRLSLASDSFKNARDAIGKAIALQPNLGYVKLNAGIVMEHDGDFLAAESYYLQAIAQNSVHYLPFERLGKLYITTGEFVKADYYLYEANKRKESFVINEPLFRQGLAMMPKTSFYFRDKDCHLQLTPGSSLEPYKNLMDALDILNMEKIDTTEAERLLTKAVEKIKELPLAKHYLAKIYFNNGKNILAEKNLKEAIAGYQNKERMTAIIYSQLQHAADTAGLSCIIRNLQDYEYNETEDFYMLANIYEQQHKNEDALSIYNKIIKIENEQLLEQASVKNFSRDSAIIMKFDEDDNNVFTPTEKFQKYNIPPIQAAYLKAASLYESEGNYAQAERLLLAQVSSVLQAGIARFEAAPGLQAIPGMRLSLYPKHYWFVISREVEAATWHFYERMLALNPLDPDPAWKGKAAFFLYNRLKLSYDQIPVQEQHLYYTAINQYAGYLTALQLLLATRLYESMKPFAYPWLPKASIQGENYTITIPDIRENIVLEIPSFEPVQEAIVLMNQAIKLSGELVPAAGMQEALADLYAWQGNAEEAIKLYRDLVNRFPSNAAMRNKLLQNLQLTSRFNEAAAQMVLLNQQELLSPVQKITLASYQLLAGKPAQADTVLQNFIPVDALQKDQLAKFYIKKYELNNQPRIALAYLEDSLPALKPSKEEVYNRKVDWNAEYFSRNYAIARLLVKTGHKKQGMNLMAKLYEEGFRYVYLVKNDATWTPIKKKKQWKNLMNKYKQGLDYGSVEAEDLNNGRWFRIPMQSFHTEPSAQPAQNN